MEKRKPATFDLLRGGERVRTEFPSIVRPPNPAYFVPPCQRTRSGRENTVGPTPPLRLLLQSPLQESPSLPPPIRVSCLQHCFSFNWSYSHWFFSFLLFKGCFASLGRYVVTRPFICSSSLSLHSYSCTRSTKIHRAFLMSLLCQ